MKHIKKFLSMLVFVAIFVASMFSMTACNLIVTDVTAYYEQVVATFEFENKTINVKMSDLNNTFKNYGYSRYKQGYYSSLEECIKDSLDYYIQKTLLINHIAVSLQEIYEDTNNELYNLSFVDFENFDWETTLENIYESDTANAKEIRYNAFTSMQETVDGFVEDILEEDDKLAEIETDQEETLRDTKEEYESALVVYEEDIFDDDGKYLDTVTKVKYNIEELELFNKSNVSKHFELVNNYSQDLTAKGYNKYINYLQQTAKSEERSTKIEDVIAFEEKANIKAEFENQLLKLYEYWYQTNQEVPTEKIVEYYKNQYNSQKKEFEDNINAYRTAMNDYTSNYVYYNNNSGQEYVVVNHILINFSAEQKAELEKLEADYERDKTSFANDTDALEALEKKYEKDRINVIVTTKSVYEVDGVQKEDYIGNIINDIKTYVSTNNIKSNEIISEKELLTKKAKNFEDMMYIYNDDSGNMNSDFYYAINVNEGVDSQYVTEFTDGGIDLYKNYQPGDVLTYPVISTYGIHIMFYSGVAGNIIESIDSLTAEMLLTNTVNPASDKTIFEYVYDTVESDSALVDNYNNYVNSLLAQMYNSANIITDEYKYNDLWS